MTERAPVRGAAVIIIDLPGDGEAYPSVPIIDLETAQDTWAALTYVIEQKDLDILDLEGTNKLFNLAGSNWELEKKKRRRDRLWQSAQYYARLVKMLDPAADGDTPIIVPGGIAVGTTKP